MGRVKRGVWGLGTAGGGMVAGSVGEQEAFCCLPGGKGIGVCGKVGKACFFVFQRLRRLTNFQVLTRRSFKR